MTFKQMGYIVSLCMAVATMNSCKKDNTPQYNVTPVLDKIKTVTTSITMETYSYDSLGRTTEMMSSAYGRQVYAYTDTSLAISYYSTTNTYQSTRVYKLNGDGLSILSYTQGISNDSIFISYWPDRFRQTFKEVVYHAGMPNESYVTTNYISNGNIDHTKQVHYSGTTPLDSSTTYYTYYVDKPNSIGPENYGRKYAGRTNINPIKSERFSFNQGPESISTHTYQFDSKNRIIEDALTNSYGTSTNTYTYY